MIPGHHIVFTADNDQLYAIHWEPAAPPPAAWLRDITVQGAPPLGMVVTMRDGFGPNPPRVTGRYVHAWNNIGRLVLPDGSFTGTCNVTLNAGNPFLHPGAVIALLEVTGCHHSTECTGRGTLMARAVLATWPGNQRNSVAEGKSVRYHGSLSGSHGTWTLGGPCCCGNCTPALDEPGAVQFVLYRFSDPGQKLSHVSCSNFTAADRSRQPLVNALEPAR